MHILEATFIAVLILTFVLAIIPSIERKENIQSAKDSFSEGLKSLDRRGVLREYVYGDPIQLANLKTNLSSVTVKRINFTVGVTTRSTETGNISVSQLVTGGYKGTYAFSIDNTSLESSLLSLTFSTQDNADFYLNNDLIGIRDTSSNVSSIDLSDRYVNGTNTFELLMPDQQNVSRKLDKQTVSRYESLPAASSVTVVGYFVAGINRTYDPREIRVYLWI